MISQDKDFPTVVVTRFAYLGLSGWKGTVDEQRETLFDEKRLRDRLDLFRDIAVASLAAQTDTDFHHYILTSTELPEWALDELHGVCRDAYDEKRYTIDRRRPAQAKKFVRLFLQQHYENEIVAQVVLDDDDGLARDFMAEIKAEAASYLQQPQPDFPYFFSWPKGYGSVFASPDQQPDLFEHSFRFINLGLTILATPTDKNILAINHMGAPRRFGATVLSDKAMFVRSVHDHNDSRVDVTKNWIKVDNWTEQAELLDRFPFMQALIR